MWANRHFYVNGEYVQLKTGVFVLRDQEGKEDGSQVYHQVRGHVAK